MAEKDFFEYTYSAPQQNEILQIREKYLPREVTKLDQLRALDESATKRGIAVSLVHGILFTLLLGFGMSCCLVWAKLFVPGILIGCIGLAGVAMTYPIYIHTVKQDREIIAPEILRLTEDIVIDSSGILPHADAGLSRSGTSTDLNRTAIHSLLHRQS